MKLASWKVTIGSCSEPVATHVHKMGFTAAHPLTSGHHV